LRASSPACLLAAGAAGGWWLLPRLRVVQLAGSWGCRWVVAAATFEGSSRQLRLQVGGGWLPRTSPLQQVCAAKAVGWVSHCQVQGVSVAGFSGGCTCCHVPAECAWGYQHCCCAWGAGFPVGWLQPCASAPALPQIRGCRFRVWVGLQCSRCCR
jgi:hypothetical protein